MDNVYDIVHRLITDGLEISADIETDDLLSYTQSFYFTLSDIDYTKYINLFSSHPECITVNGYIYNCDPEIEDLNNIQISISENFFAENKSQFNHFIIYDEKVFEKFIDFFFRKIKIRDLKGVRDKARISFFRKINIDFSNSIFTTSELGEELHIPKFIFFDSYYSSLSIASLPRAVPKVFINILLGKIIQAQFEMISNHFIDNNKFVIYSEKNIVFEMKDILISKGLAEDLEDIIIFIFEDERHYYDKLEIFRNVFSLNFQKENEVSEHLSERLLEETKSQYSLYISDTLGKFLQDKQMITEKYINFMQNISERSKILRDEIQKEILTLIGIVISTFFITGIDNGLAVMFPSALGLVYLCISYYLKEKSDWYENSNFFKNEIEFMNSTYGKIYKYDIAYSNELLENYVNPEIEKLKSIENRFRSIYIIFIILFGLWFLYALFFQSLENKLSLEKYYVLKLVLLQQVRV